MQTNTTLIALVAASLAASAAQAATIYNNATTYTTNFFNPGASEVGDEVIMGGTDRVGESFSFEYYGNALGIGGITNETVRIRFYQNDGPLYPNTVFFDSGVQSLPHPDNADGRNVLQYDISSITQNLPEHFTWSVQFGGIELGETAGLSLYNPPTIGNGYDDYWFNNGATWETRVATNGTPISFGALITAVPEPSTYVLMALGLGVVWFLRRR